MCHQLSILLEETVGKSERDTIVPLSSLVCYSALAIFKIHIFIMRGEKKGFNSICMSLTLQER